MSLRLRHPSSLPAWWPELKPQLIMIVGPSNSGKSTLAQRLGKHLELPAFDLDELNWLPGWQMRSSEELRESVRQIVDTPAWVLAGNYERTQDLSWPQAQVVIWLDFEKDLVLKRALKRCLYRYFLKEACCNGNYESLRMTFFSRDSLLLWILKVHARQRLRYQERAKEQTGPLILHLHQPREIEILFKR